MRGVRLLLAPLLIAAAVRAGSVDVLHDDWGVPHIFAADRGSMAYGYGYASAEDHGELCLALYAGARCKSAQYYGGPLGGTLASLVDRFLLSFGARRLGEAYYDSASDFTREIMDGFAAGFSEYVQANRGRFSEGGLAVVDDGNITGLDIATHSAFNLQLFVSTSVFGRLIDTLDAQRNYSAAEAELAARIDPTWAHREYLRRRDARGDFNFLKDESGAWRPAGDPHAMGTLGSNAMAAVREGGGSVLHINPHLLWAPSDTPFQAHDGSAMNFYETHIEVEGDVAAYGASLVGMPVLAVAFTKKAGWAHTVGRHRALRSPAPPPTHLPSSPVLNSLLMLKPLCCRSTRRRRTACTA
jgi:acyl-homoserine-lactone acylase